MLACALLVSVSAKLPAQVISNNGAVMSITSGTILIGGDIGNSAGTISNNGTISLTGTYTNASTTNGNGAYNIGGNWTNNGTFTPGTSTVTMDGISSQLLSGTTSITFNNLTIVGATDTSAANYKIVQTTTSITGILTVSSGNTLDLGTFTSSIASGANNGKIRWAGSNVYVSGIGTTEFYGSTATAIAIGANYGNILIWGSGTNTISGSVTAISGLAVVGVTVNSNLTVTGTLTVTGMDLVNNGSITNNGTITVQ